MFLIRSSVDTHLGCFHILYCNNTVVNAIVKTSAVVKSNVIINHTGMNIGVHVYF